MSQALLLYNRVLRNASKKTAYHLFFFEELCPFWRTRQELPAGRSALGLLLRFSKAAQKELDRISKLLRYATSTSRRLEMLEFNGYYPGENLILTMETEDNPLNTKLIVHLIKKYLL